MCVLCTILQQISLTLPHKGSTSYMWSRLQRVVDECQTRDSNMHPCNNNSYDCGQTSNGSSSKSFLSPDCMSIAERRTSFRYIVWTLLSSLHQHLQRNLAGFLKRTVLRVSSHHPHCKVSVAHSPRCSAQRDGCMKLKRLWGIIFSFSFDDKVLT